MRTHRLPVGLAAVAIAALALAPVAAATPRSGDVHITKDCSAFTGQAGDFCTITSSDLRAIPVGARIVYASARRRGDPRHGHLDRGRPRQRRLRVTAGSTSWRCRVVCTLSGGTGTFRHLHLEVAVSPDATPNLWHWDGTFAFGGGS